MSFERWNIRPDPSAPLGSPENPEIIEPGERPRARSTPPPRPPASGAGRARRALQIFMWMVTITAPALFLDSVWFWLFDSATQGGGVIAWLLLLLFTPPALLMTLVATVADSFLIVFFFANLLGKPVAGRPPGFVKFIRF